MPPSEITHLLSLWQQGDLDAEEQLMAQLYPDLRRVAGARLAGEGPITLEPTDLVHEAYLRLGAQRAGWENREQFFAIASRLMRRIVMDHVRHRGRAKRGGQAARVTLRTDSLAGEPRSLDFLTLDHALEELLTIDPEAVRVVEMRFFAGMSTDEVSQAMGTSPSTVGRRWRFARAWLERRLQA